jgi:hypothetical protein
MGSSQSGFRQSDKVHKISDSSTVSRLTKRIEQMERQKQLDAQRKYGRPASQNLFIKKKKTETDINDPLNNLGPKEKKSQAYMLYQNQPPASSKNTITVKSYPESEILYDWYNRVKSVKGMLGFLVSDQVNFNDNVFDRVRKYYKDLFSEDYNEKQYQTNYDLIFKSVNFIGQEHTLAVNIYSSMNNDINNCKGVLTNFVNPIAYADIINKAIEYALNELQKKMDDIKSQISNASTDNEKELIPNLRNQLSIFRQSILDETGSIKYDTSLAPKITSDALDADETNLNSWGELKTKVKTMINEKLNISNIDCY